jgi:hypothetical protein
MRPGVSEFEHDEFEHDEFEHDLVRKACNFSGSGAYTRIGIST